MTPVELLLERLPGWRKSGKEFKAKCPAHDDQNPSLSIGEGEDGRALVFCHAGCTLESILAAIGLRSADLRVKTSTGKLVWPQPSRGGKSVGTTFPTAEAAIESLERGRGEHSAIWNYHNDAGELVGVVVRWNQAGGKKTFRPVSLHEDGWRLTAMAAPAPLYCLPEIAAASRIIVCEGEGCAEAARSLGFVATTSVGGSQAAAKTDWRPLAGKEVWILPDKDLPGSKYGRAVSSILAKLTPNMIVKIVRLPDLPEGGDIVDWINAHGDAAEPDSMRVEIEAMAVAIQPETTSCEVEKFRPFPVDALPESARGFVTAGAKAIGCDASYLALPLLTVMAAAIGSTRRLQLKRGWYAPAIIWGVIVGESGTAKTPAFKLIMEAIRKRQRKAMKEYEEAMKLYELEFAKWEKSRDAWKRSKVQDEDPPAKPDAPLCNRFIVSDTTVEALAPILLANPRGLLLSRDELAGWIGSFDRYAGKGKAPADSSNWLSMFNAENITVDRKTGFPRTIFVPHAAMCICGGIQPGILNRALGDEHRESGLAARLLLTCPPRKAKKWTEADIDPLLELAFAKLVDRLFELETTENEEGEPCPVLVRMTDDAMTAWKSFYNAHATEQADLTGDLSAAWSKFEEYAARLALVIHYIRWAAGDVANEQRLDLDSMTAGIVLVNWFKAETRRVYALLAESEEDRDLRRLVEWIDRKGGSVTVRETQQGCRWLKEPGEAERALELLVKAGKGAWQPSASTSQGGRPTQLFVFSKESTVYETSEKPAEEEGSVDVDAVDESIKQSKKSQLFPDLRGLPD